MTAKRAGTGLLLLAALLTGCSGDREFRDLQDFMAKARAQPGGKIEPIPSFPPYEGFKYSAMALRSPFDRSEEHTSELQSQ